MAYAEIRVAVQNRLVQCEQIVNAQSPTVEQKHSLDLIKRNLSIVSDQEVGAEIDFLLLLMSNEMLERFANDFGISWVQKITWEN